MNGADHIPLYKAEKIICTIAFNNSEYENYLNTNQLVDIIEAKIALPPEFAQETLAALATDPKQAYAINSLSKNLDITKSFVSGTEISLLVAVVFILRTHIKLERTTTGKWKFLIEHKPSDSKILTELLKKLEKWWTTTSP